MFLIDGRTKSTVKVTVFDWDQSDNLLGGHKAIAFISAMARINYEDSGSQQ